jgi:hypothetical protein
MVFLNSKSFNFSKAIFFISIKQFLICSFVIGFEGKLDKCESRVLNHKGASDFSNDILNYLKKEASYGAIIGPFKNNPFVQRGPLSFIIPTRSATFGYDNSTFSPK